MEWKDPSDRIKRFGSRAGGRQEAMGATGSRGQRKFMIMGIILNFGVLLAEVVTLGLRLNAKGPPFLMTPWPILSASHALDEGLLTTTAGI